MLGTEMNMLITLLNKAYLFVFFVGCLYALRHAILFFIAVQKAQKYQLSNRDLIYLGASVAIILTIIFSGIKLF